MAVGGMIGRAGGRREGGGSGSNDPRPDPFDLNGRHRDSSRLSSLDEKMKLLKNRGVEDCDED